MEYKQPNENGFFGRFGGRFIPETLMTAVLELMRLIVKPKLTPVFRLR